jgi:DNA modification methylase
MTPEHKHLEYTEFLRTKQVCYESTGFEVAENDIHPALFDFQNDIVRWALKKGKSALFAGTGLGKSLMQLEWANHVHIHEERPILILAPLAVASQTVKEGAKFGIESTLCRSQQDVINGINITNYDMLHHFNASEFVGIVLDESSILKSFTGKFRTQIIESFANTPYKLACTATPAPNDHIELTNHSDFIGAMTGSEMLSMFFVHDSDGIGNWRLKGHSVDAFWEWMASWAVMLTKPSDLGYENRGFDLLPLTISQITVDKTGYRVKEAQTLTERRNARRNSLDKRVEAAVDLMNEHGGKWILWCDLNDESDALTKAIDGAVEIRGSHDRAYKTEKMTAFANGEIDILVSKPSICGFGMNFQVCHNMAFVGVSDSFEKYYQAVRRCWRFGQTEPVNVYVITSEAEGAVVKNINRKEKDFKAMQQGMISATQELTKRNVAETKDDISEHCVDSATGQNWDIYLDDNIEHTRTMADDSVDFTVFSPPFSSLFVYSDSARDMGNCHTDEEFYAHFGYLAPELYRVLKPGRIMAVHCMNLPSSLAHDGCIGLKDFRGDLIRIFQNAGFIFHSEVCIWKDPVQEMYRSKSIRLLHKQLKKDSCMSGNGRADYMLMFRKPGANIEPVTHDNESFPVPVWQRYASPVWTDINQMDVLSKRECRIDNDERHICPLQLGVIQRCIEMWTNPDDLVYDPFAGIGSTLYQAIFMGRRGIGCELKQSYFDQAIKNLVVADREARAPKQVGFDYYGIE